MEPSIARADRSRLRAAAMDKLFGLPAHPFLVHVPIVLLPLSAIGVVLMAVRPSWHRSYRWVVLAIGVVGALGPPWRRRPAKSSSIGSSPSRDRERQQAGSTTPSSVTWPGPWRWATSRCSCWCPGGSNADRRPPASRRRNGPCWPSPHWRWLVPPPRSPRSCRPGTPGRGRSESTT
jgi:hypothetical protein